MQIKIVHETIYHYSEPVFLEPHSLRFRTHGSPVVTLKRADLSVSPEPAGISLGADAEGNWVDTCWFNGLHKQLSLKWELEVHIADRNPFDFIVYPSYYLNLPFVYDAKIDTLLRPFLMRDLVSDEFIAYRCAVGRIGQ
jgi:transglutaminase-like putative cysteine protease